MRCWGFGWHRWLELAPCVGGILLSLGGSRAAAQPADVVGTAELDAAAASPAVEPLGYGAMPGGLHAPTADTNVAGTFGMTALGGFGARNTLLSADHKLKRGIANVAFSYAATDMITIALAFDGRFDKHSGVSPAGDDGYVGDPHLFARIAKGFGSLRVGGQLGVWVPGKDAPSVAASAISVEARGLVSLQAGPGRIGFNAGFRLDNSAESVDQPELLSVEDRVSLGVSDFHAVLAGAHFTVPVGKAFIGLEATTEVFVGSGAPGPILRAGATAGFQISGPWAVFAFVEGAKVPGLTYSDVMNGEVTLVPYEPVITGGLGIQARFGRGAGGGSTTTIARNDKPQIVEVIEYAELTGQVLDDLAKPMVGATVTVKLKTTTASVVTDATGTYAARVPIGKTVDGTTTLDDTGAQVTVEVEGKKPSTSTVTLVKGPNPIARLVLDPLLPPGTLKALIRAAGTGKALANAVVTIEPGTLTTTSDAEGRISIDLPPGTYTATATSPGFKTQTLDVVIEGGVVVKNFELPR